MKKHFVTFLSPGTLFHETTEKPIESWDIIKACDMAHTIQERHGATPFAFFFTTRSRTEQDLDSRVTETGPTYYLGGEVLTLAQVKAKKDPKNDILIRNMEANKWKKVIINTNSWRVDQPLNENDVVLDWKPKRITTK